jgi:hypothetical protein
VRASCGTIIRILRHGRSALRSVTRVVGEIDIISKITAGTALTLTLSRRERGPRIHRLRKVQL